MEPVPDTETSGLRSEESCPKVNDHGITVLYTPKSGLCEADLVFVHGLGGHPFKTWAYGKVPKLTPSSKPQKGSKKLVSSRRERADSPGSTQKSEAESPASKPRKGLRKLIPSFHKRVDSPGSTNTSEAESPSSQAIAQDDASGASNKKSYCYWPFDLVKDAFPTVRVMTYGYDSKPSHFYRGRTTQMNISQHAEQLRQSVSEHRVECHGRPIIFVAHSLGGILVKDAIIQAAKYEYQPHLSELSKSCFAFVFFGTPHRGANAAAYGEIVANVVDSLPFAPGVYKEVLHGLRPDGEKISNVEKDFNDIINRNIPGSEKIQIYSFQEGQGLTSLNTLDGKVVPDSSSHFNRRDIEQTSFIMANHLEMCRFTTDGRPAFPAFKAAVLGYMVRTRERRGLEQVYENTVQAELSKALDFDERCQRQHDLASLQTFDETFAWVWQSVFVDWLKASDPLFWISGKPASGKSTLINHLTIAPETRRIAKDSLGSDFVLIHHFFDFRAGDRIGNNFRGFLRSLLTQLLNELSGDTPGISKIKDTFEEHHNRNKTVGSLPLSFLRASLVDILAGATHGILILLDGLDEYAGNLVELASFIKGLHGHRLKICLASRPDPPFPDSFGSAPGFKMDRVNRTGIGIYASRSLYDAFSHPEGLSRSELDRIASSIVELAEGVFLWARFAVLELISEVCQGYDADATIFQTIIRQIPKELSDIYRRIFQRLSERDKKTCALVLLLVTGSIETVSLNMLQMTIKILPKNLPFLNSLELHMEMEQILRFKKRITAATWGLTEVLPPRGEETSMGLRNTESIGNLIVRLAHRTVETYLDKGGWEVLLGEDFYVGLSDELWLRASVATICTRKTQLAQMFQKVILEEGPLKYASHSNETKFDQLMHQMLVRVIEHTPNYASNFEQNSGRSSLPVLKGAMSTGIASIHISWSLKCPCMLIGRWVKSAWPSMKMEGTVRDILHFATAHALHLFIRDFLADHRDQTVGELDYLLGRKHVIGTSSQMNACSKRETHDYSIIMAESESVVVTEVFLLFAVLLANHQFAEDVRMLLRTVLDASTTVPDHIVFVALKESTFEAVEMILQYRGSSGLSLSELRKLESTYLTQRVDLLAEVKCGHEYGLFWPVAQRDGDLRDTEKCIDLLLERGSDITAQCGPFGTVLHSLVDTQLSRSFLDVRGHEWFVVLLNLLLRKGADVNAPGPYGNALELAWLGVNQKKCRRLAHEFNYHGMIKSLIEAGGVNNRKDPNGLIPSVESMLFWANNPDKGKELTRFYWHGHNSSSAEVGDLGK